MNTQDGLDPVWEDMDRALGQLFMMGFEGDTVTPQIRKLIQEHSIGSILLTAKNLKSAEQTTQLVLELQQCAFDAQHPVPLIIAIDQENGGVNSLFDEIYIRQYPSAMGLAATGSLDLAMEVAKATAEEVSACGINLLMGPVLDVLTNTRNQPLGVRTHGDDPQEVSSYGVAFVKGFKQAGLATMGKHFPACGSLELLGSALDVPTITESLELLSLTALVPYRSAIHQGLDAVMVGGCAMSSAGLNVMHACLSDRVVNDLLRKDLGFDGVAISDCLEMEALSHNIGVGGGTVMAINAGCDIVLLCRSATHQHEALEGFKLGLKNAMITRARLRVSLKRVLDLKAKCTSWEKALNPPGVGLLSTLQPHHTKLSTKAYNSSITVVRDIGRLLPLRNVIEAEDELLLLTPLVKPLAASAAVRQISEQMTHGVSHAPAMWKRSASVMSGELVFRELGRSLARQRYGRVLHSSYTANGVRPQHENLINRASATIIVTADANRNQYQHAFAKHVSMLCKTQQGPDGDRREKPVIVVAVSSPYDFAMDQTIGTYVCTYDFTETALNSLVKALYGEFTPAGMFPGTMGRSRKLSQSKQHWLVEAFNEERDSHALDALIKTVVGKDRPEAHGDLVGATSNSLLVRNANILEAHFVVRNSSTKSLYGFCSTYFFTLTGTGAIGSIFVDPGRRKLSIGHSLHTRAIQTLLQRDGIKRLQLGSTLPSIYPGIPIGESGQDKNLHSWFSSLGWPMAPHLPTVCTMINRDMSAWTIPEGKAVSLQSAGTDFDLVYGWEHAGPVLEHIKSNNRPELAELYKIALEDAASCGIIRAKRSKDDALVGTLVLYNMQSRLAELNPRMKAEEASGQIAGGISSPVISPSVDEKSAQLLLQGLVLLGMRQIKQQSCNVCLLNCIDGNNIDILSALGLSILRSHCEASCDEARWTMSQSNSNHDE